MLVEVLALTLLSLAFGLAAFNLATPSRELSGGFFALHGVLALPALLLALVASGRSGLVLRPVGGWPSPVLLTAVSVASLVLHTLLAHGGKLGAARLALLPGVVTLAMLLGSRASAAPFAGRGLGAGWLAAGLLLGGLLFGAVVWAMNLGHWYLVSKTLPFKLLVHGAEAFGALALLRALFVVATVAVAVRSPGETGASTAHLLDLAGDGLFFWSRVLWGLAATVVLAPFVVKTARMKSNQAATGLLYVGVVFVMIGELLSTYLTLRTGLPV